MATHIKRRNIIVPENDVLLLLKTLHFKLPKSLHSSLPITLLSIHHQAHPKQTLRTFLPNPLQNIEKSAGLIGGHFWNTVSLVKNCLNGFSSSEQPLPRHSGHRCSSAASGPSPPGSERRDVRCPNSRTRELRLHYHSLVSVRTSALNHKTPKLVSQFIQPLFVANLLLITVGHNPGHFFFCCHHSYYFYAKIPTHSRL